MIKLIFITLFLLLIIIFTYFKIKYQFWSIQPVFHIYDLHFWLFPNQIVNPSLPKINKFVKLLDVETFNIKNCPSKILTDACLFIKENYLTVIKYFIKLKEIFREEIVLKAEKSKDAGMSLVKT